MVVLLSDCGPASARRADAHNAQPTRRSVPGCRAATSEQEKMRATLDHEHTRAAMLDHRTWIGSQWTLPWRNEGAGVGVEQRPDHGPQIQRQEPSTNTHARGTAAAPNQPKAEIRPPKTLSG